jgi:hypothetical protein
MSADSLELTLTTDKPAYRVGEPIELILKLTNRSPQPTVLEFSSSQRYDFEIGEWHWSADRMFAQMLGTERLEPGESREYRERFLSRLAPGSYRATGRITATGSTARASATFTVQ